MKNFFSEIQLKSNELKIEREHLNAIKERLNQIGNNHDEIHKLDVGGKCFKVQWKHLMKVPASDLAAYFSGIHQPKLTYESRFFLDRDGETFKYVLSYLKND